MYNNFDNLFFGGMAPKLRGHRAPIQRGLSQSGAIPAYRTGRRSKSHTRRVGLSLPVRSGGQFYPWPERIVTYISVQQLNYSGDKNNPVRNNTYHSSSKHWSVCDCSHPKRKFRKESNCTAHQKNRSDISALLG